MSLNALSIAAVETHPDPAIHPYVVGVIALGILLALLLGLLSFAGGREHS